MTSLEDGLTRTALFIFNYLNIKIFCNKIKNTGLLQLFFYLLILVVSFYLCFKTIYVSFSHFFVFNIDSASVYPEKNIFWLAAAYFFIRQYTFDKIPIKPDDGYLISLTKAKINSYLLYQFFSSISNFLLPLFLASTYYVLTHSLEYAFVLFAYFWMFNVFIYLFNYLLKCLFFDHLFFIKPLKAIFIILFGASIFVFCQRGISIPEILYKSFYPFIVLIASFVSPQNYNLIGSYWSLIVPSSVALLFWAFVVILKRSKFSLVFESSKKEKAGGGGVEGFHFSHEPFFNKEMKKLTSFFKSDRQWAVLFFPAAFFIYFSMLAQLHPEDIQGLKKILILLLVVVISIPGFLFFPLLSKERQFFWFYKLNTGTKNYFFNKTVFFYSIVSLIFFSILFTGVYVFSVFMSFPFFSLMESGYYFFFGMNLIFVPILISIILIMTLPGIYFKGENFNPLILIFLIWFFIIAILPPLIIIAKSPVPFSFFLILLYNLSCFFLFRFAFSKILDKKEL